jgi:hypothetical protein
MCKICTYLLRQMNESYRILIGKPEGKESVVRPRQISKNVKYVYVECENVYWIQMAQDRIQWTCTLHS